MTVVDVWLTVLGGVSGQVTDALVRMCDEREHARAARLPAAAAGRRWLLARGAVRVVLAGYAGIDPVVFRFASAPGRPPRIEPDWLGLRFSVSHAGEAVAVAVAPCEVGVDVERRDPALDAEAITRRFFPSEQGLGFYRGWTRREAWLKADGGGWGRPLDAVAVPPAGAWLPDPVAVPADPAWAVADVQAPEGYVAAVAARGSGWRPIVRHWQPGITAGPKRLIGVGVERLRYRGRLTEA